MTNWPPALQQCSWATARKIAVPCILALMCISHEKLSVKYICKMIKVFFCLKKTLINMKEQIWIFFNHFQGLGKLSISSNFAIDLYLPKNCLICPQVERTSCSAVTNTTMVIALQWLHFGQTRFASKDIRHTKRRMLTLIHRLMTFVWDLCLVQRLTRTASNDPE